MSFLHENPWLTKFRAEQRAHQDLLNSFILLRFGFPIPSGIREIRIEEMEKRNGNIERKTIVYIIERDKSFYRSTSPPLL
jgi:hypothetical protein